MGLLTNWMGVRMLFYPIDYIGLELYREEDCPYGVLGWQGVVPARTKKMATRLTEVVTCKLFSLTEAFAHVEPAVFANLLLPTVTGAIEEHAPNGRWWAWALKPFLPWALRRVVVELQEEIETVLDPERVVMSAFVRDKRVLVELFERVGRVELDFLVRSGSYFGAMLGLVQMSAWVAVPQAWTLPIAGALVGYMTNWIAIKLLFEPAEPVVLCGSPFGDVVMQGLFEKRQPEVSEAMSAFLAERVLTAPRLLEELVAGRWADRFEALLRRSIPFVVPDSVVSAARQGLVELAREPASHPTHVYLADKLGVEATLCTRLQRLPPAEFEDLLHPVFQEDEIILIVVGGALGAVAGLLQMRFGVGGPLPAKRLAERVMEATKANIGKALKK